ncbi:MAG: SGNH/GDSL hydrolase family protein, partial [Pseudomonadales bacterium]|nr:SGNH/GDSL hydrolase family protein [Pseudomonadales bacterium]
MKKIFKILLINCIFFFLFSELVFFSISATAYLTKAPWAQKIAVITDKAFSWETAFLDNYKKGKLVYLNIHQPHETRGWSMIPGKTVKRGGNTYSSNAQGFRSTYDFVNDSRFKIMLIGDSFTFGDDADDKEIWPWLLQQKDSKFNVLNMGGTGYGVDQMLLTLQEQIEQYSPQIVIAAFISDDLVRS